LFSSDGDSIRVFVRVRPPENSMIGGIGSEDCLHTDEDKNAIIMHCKPDPKVFTFDQVVEKDVTQVGIILKKKIFVQGISEDFHNILLKLGCKSYFYGEFVAIFFSGRLNSVEFNPEEFYMHPL
jgi:hypothetical protein